MEDKMIIEPKPPDPAPFVFELPKGKWGKQFLVMAIAENLEKKPLGTSVHLNIKADKYEESQEKSIKVHFGSKITTLPCSLLHKEKSDVELRDDPPIDEYHLTRKKD